MNVGFIQKTIYKKYIILKMEFCILLSFIIKQTYITIFPYVKINFIRVNGVCCLFP